MHRKDAVPGRPYALGEPVSAVLTAPGGELRPGAAPNPYAAGGQDADVYIDPADFRAVFAADVPAGTAAGMAATQRPLSVTAQTEPSGDPAWKTIPSWALITLDDKAIPPAGQKYMAARANAHVETVRSSHAVMVSHPAAVTRIILNAARSLSS
ncbi:alpha/beta fold hydrolase [Actinomadura oligospora]|uniref:alpha/beta fold hydrolase n=1 Tax=Actinomadura oligospora TaxID=111804 RepID=UPI0004B6F462|nr:alpha/beta fold hydrolase [Actinomadura oligospora]